jgi:hypothetical protein
MNDHGSRSCFGVKAVLSFNGQGTPCIDFQGDDGPRIG